MAKKADAELKVKVKTEGKDELKQLQTELDKTKEKTKDLGGAATESSTNFKDFTSGLAGFATGLAAAGAAAIAFVVKSDKFEQVQKSFERMVASQGINADQFLAKMTEMTNGTMSQMDMMLATNKAAMLGLPLEKFPEMMKIAQSAAMSTGESMQFMTDSIVLALGRQSKLILDNLGIIVDAEEANKKYAASHGLIAEKLTESEKKQAFMNAAIEAGLRNVQLAGDHGETMAMTWDKIKAKTEDLAIAFGQVLKPVMKPVIEMMFDFFGIMSDIVKSDAMAATLKNIAKGFNFIGGFIDQVTIQAMKFGEVMKMAWGYATFNSEMVAEAKSNLANLKTVQLQNIEDRLAESGRLEDDYNKERVKKLMESGAPLMAADLEIAKQINEEKLKKDKELVDLKKAVDDQRRADELKAEKAQAKEVSKVKIDQATLDANKLSEIQPTVDWGPTGMPELTPGVLPPAPAMGPEPASAETEGGFNWGKKSKEAGTKTAQAFFDGMVQGGEGGARKFLSGMSAGIAETFVPGLGQAVGPLVDMLSQPPEELKKSITSFAEAIPTLLDNIVENIPVILEVLASKADTIIIALVKHTPKMAIALAQAMPIVAKELAKAIQDQFHQAGRTLSDEFERWGEQIRSINLSEVFQKMGDFLSQLPQKISQGFVNLGTNMSEAFTNAFNNIGTTLGNAVKGILTFKWPSFSFPAFPSFKFPSLPSFSWPSLPKWHWPEIKAPEWLSRLSIGGGGGGGGGGVTGFISNVGGKLGLNNGGIVPGIQHFASGGTVDTVPAMLTPGEFVVNNAASSRHRGTLEAINSGRSPSMGNVINITVQGGLLGDAQTAREFARAIDRELLNLRRDNESVAFDSGVV